LLHQKGKKCKVYNAMKDKDWVTKVELGADEGMTPRVLDIDLPATTQEQDGHLKPKKPKTN
jgi:hypothetical protein